jgi:gluconolactonase
MSNCRVLANALRFPEGPVAMRDGSVMVAEIAGGEVTRISSDGTATCVVRTGGGPNGMAFGPGGALFVCNNGGNEYHEGSFRARGPAKNYVGGSIQRVDISTGEIQELYTHCGADRLSSPNDIVFDAQGGFYFTDMGKRKARDRSYGGVYYARADGSDIMEVAYPVMGANGIGLSPDGKVLYVAETETARLSAFDIVAPGVVHKHPFPSPHGGRTLCGLPGLQYFDSLAVEAGGNICVGTLLTGYITVVSPDGAIVRQVKVPDTYPTNICFGGSGLKTAYITLSGRGELVAMDWPEPGLALNYSV